MISPFFGFTSKLQSVFLSLILYLLNYRNKKMTSTQKNWIDFWDEQTVMDGNSWHKNMELFVEGSRSFFPFNEEDDVLDIGSGPGYLAYFLKDKVKSIHCLDTSKGFIEDGKMKFAGDDKVTFSLLGEDYLDLSMLEGKKFTKIVCSSVIQYYKHIDEVQRLIREIQGVAAPSAQMLIADISVETSLFKDLSGLMKTAWKKKYLFQVIKFIVQSYTSEYADMRKNVGLLSIKQKDLDRIISSNNLTAEWRDDVLTLNDTRKHLLISF